MAWRDGANVKAHTSITLRAFPREIPVRGRLLNAVFNHFPLEHFFSNQRESPQEPISVQMQAVRIRHSIRESATQPVIVLILQGGKPKWLPWTLDSMMLCARPPFQNRHVARTSPSSFSEVLISLIDPCDQNKIWKKNLLPKRNYSRKKIKCKQRRFSNNNEIERKYC